MVWGFIRVAIFTGSFFIGLMFFGSGGSSADSKIVVVQGRQETVQARCSDTKVVLVKGHETRARGAHPVGM